MSLTINPQNANRHTKPHQNQIDNPAEEHTPNRPTFWVHSLLQLEKMRVSPSHPVTTCRASNHNIIHLADPYASTMCLQSRSTYTTHPNIAGFAYSAQSFGEQQHRCPSPQTGVSRTLEKISRRNGRHTEVLLRKEQHSAGTSTLSWGGLAGCGWRKAIGAMTLTYMCPLSFPSVLPCS